MMQLILETEPSGDIDTMSMEVDAPVNCAIVELKNELNQANKENTLVEKDINIPEITTAAELNLDIIKETVLDADEILENNTIVKDAEKNIEIDKLTKASNEEDDDSDFNLQTKESSSDTHNVSFPGVTNSDGSIEMVLGDEDDPTAEQESHIEKDFQTSNNDINMEINVEEAQFSPVGETTDDVLQEEMKTVNADINTDDVILEEMKTINADINTDDVIQKEMKTINADINTDDVIQKEMITGNADVNTDDVIQEEIKTINADINTDDVILEEMKTTNADINTDDVIQKEMITGNADVNTDDIIQEEIKAINADINTDDVIQEEIKTVNADINTDDVIQEEMKTINADINTDDVIQEEIKTINADKNTEILENAEQLQGPTEVKEDNVLCVEPPLINSTTNLVEESSFPDTEVVLNNELNLQENDCANENKLSEATMEIVTETSNDKESIDTLDLEEIDSKKLNDTTKISNISFDDNIDNHNNLDKEQACPVNNDNTEKNAIEILGTNEEVKEQIDISLENDNALTWEEKELEDVIMDEEEILETENSLQEIDNNVVEKKFDAAPEEIFNVEDEEVLPETNNQRDGSLKNTETVSNQIEITSGTDTMDKNEKLETEVTSEGKEIPDIKSNDLSMDIDIPKVSEIIEMVCENKTVNDSDDISLDTVPEATDVTEVLEKEIENGNETSKYVDLDNDLKDDAQKDIAHDKKMETERKDNVQIIDDDINIIEDDEESKTEELKETKTLPVVCKLSNTLDILSDEEDEPSKVDPKPNDASEKQCIDIDDDDDIMFIEDDSSNSNSKEPVESDVVKESKLEDAPTSPTTKTDSETGEKETTPIDITESTKTDEIDNADTTKTEEKAEPTKEKIGVNEEKPDEKAEKPLLPEKFLKTAKKNLGEMTRDELEDFCIMKIVESLVDRSGLGEIKNKMKVMSRNLEEYRKKVLLLTKHNRDLQVVLKSVQEEQKKRSNVIQPLKITRSVGMQVLMTDKPNPRRQGPIPSQNPTRPVRSTTLQNKNANNVNKAPGAIPFPRLVPANNAANKTPVNSPAKIGSPNGMRIPSPATIPKAPEKRTQGRLQSSSSVTVDLTDDEPPAKITKVKPGPLPPVRLVPSQNLMQPKGQSFPNNNSNTPRKVYIPISGPQQQTIRPGQTLMIKSVPTASTPGPRARMPAVPATRTPVSSFKAQDKLRHPAPLPEAVKQYTPATWKALPPAPDLKLSKVENGIVISWKIDGIPESAYETVASYQLYAYQETSSPPSTGLWKKIGDVKALPLPMACTLTQFMAGFKYYFAVRAVDIRSRLGPFSIPGSILLLSKV